MAVSTKPRLSTHLRTVFEDGCFADCEIRFAGQAVRLHRLVLSSCPYFRALMDWGACAGPAAPAMDIDVSAVCPGEDVATAAAAVRSVLGCLYGVPCEVTALNWRSLLQLGAFLDVATVGEACAKYVNVAMGPETCIAFANAVCSVELGPSGSTIVELCISYLHRHAVDMPALLPSLNLPLLLSILSSPNLWCPCESDRLALVASVYNRMFASAAPAEALAALQQLVPTACRLEHMCPAVLAGLVQAYSNKSGPDCITSAHLLDASAARLAISLRLADVGKSAAVPSEHGLLLSRTFRFAVEFGGWISARATAAILDTNESVTTTMLSPAEEHVGSHWALEARKISRRAAAGVVHHTIAVFLKRTPIATAEGATVTCPDTRAVVPAKFSIRMLGASGCAFPHSIVGQSSCTKAFGPINGEDKWGWYNFVQWEEAVQSNREADVPGEAMRFVLVMETS